MNAINTLFSEFPNHERKQVCESLTKYKYVLVEPDLVADESCTLVFVNDKSHLQYNEKYKHHAFTDNVKDYNLLVAYPKKVPAEAEWHDCANIKKPEYTPVLFSDLDKLVAISVDRQIENVMGILMDDLPFEEYDINYPASAEFLYAEQNMNKFRCEKILEHSTSWDGSYSHTLLRIYYSGTPVAYATVSGKHGDCYDVRVIKLEAYKGLLEYIEAGITTNREVTDIDTYTGTSEVDFLSRELSILLESGEQEYINV